MEKTNEKNRRNQLVVNQELQGRFLLAVGWPVVICLSLNIVLLGIVFANLTGRVVRDAPELEWIVPVLVGVLAALALASGFFLFHALKLSHRIAGPMVRIRRDLERVRHGEVGLRIRLRKGDYLVQVADDINELLEWMESGRREGKVGSEAEDSPSKISKTVDPTSPAEPCAVGEAAHQSE